jgi:hypothetical protein
MIVNAARGGGVGMPTMGQPDIQTPTRYGRSVGGYRYDKMSDPARIERARVAKAERDATAPTEVEVGPLEDVVGPDGQTIRVPRAAAVGKAVPRKATAGDDAPKPSDMASLRGQFNGEQAVKDATVVHAALKRVRKAANDPSAAGDLSLIFAYMKMLDPNSSVRETEYANAQNAAGVPDQVRNLWNRAQKGERLNPAQRADFLRQAQAQADGQREILRGVVGRYSEIATRNKMNPKDVVYDPFEAEGDDDFTDAELTAAWNAGKRTDAEITAYITAQRKPRIPK